MADLGWCKTHDLPGDDDSSCCWKCRGEIEAARQAKRDSVLLAAREEGRREGYAQALADDLVERRKAGNCPSCGWAGGHSNACGMIADAVQRGYDACTADAVALLSGGRTPDGEAITSARHAAEVIRRGDHVGAAAGKGKL